MKKRKKYLVKVNEEKGIIYAISMVKSPAIEEDFLLFNKEEDVLKFEVIDKVKMEVTGAIMIPDLPILRQNEETNEYYDVIFEKEGIEILRNKFMENGWTKNINLHHKFPVGSVSIVEFWTILDSNLDKAKALGFDYPVGTLMGTVKINDKELWDREIVTGNVKGFSIEIKGFGLEEVDEYSSINEEELIRIKTLLEEYKRCGAEHFDAASNKIQLAMNGKNIVSIYYEGDATVKPGWRYVEIYAFGYSLAGNRVIRAWARPGSTSLSGEVPGWKMFIVEKITDWRMSKKRYQGTRPGYNKADKGMKNIIDVI